MGNTFINKSSRDLDSEFSQNMRILSRAAATNHPLAKVCISRYLEMHIQKKIDLELANSFQKVFKYL